MNPNSAFGVIWERKCTGKSCIPVPSLCRTTAFTGTKEARLERKHRKPEHWATTGCQWVSLCGHELTSSHQHVKSTSEGHYWRFKAIQNVGKGTLHLSRPWRKPATALLHSWHLHCSAITARSSSADSTPSRFSALLAEPEDVTSFSFFLFFPFLRYFT